MRRSCKTTHFLREWGRTQERKRNWGDSGDHEWKVGELATRTISKISTIRMEIMEQERHSSRRTQTKKIQIGGTRQKGTRNNELPVQSFFLKFFLGRWSSPLPSWVIFFFASLVLYFWTHCSYFFARPFRTCLWRSCIPNQSDVVRLAGSPAWSSGRVPPRLKSLPIQAQLLGPPLCNSGVLTGGI